MLHTVVSEREARTTGIIYIIRGVRSESMASRRLFAFPRRRSDEDADARSDRDSAEEKYETDIKQYSSARKL